MIDGHDMKNYEPDNSNWNLEILIGTLAVAFIGCLFGGYFALGV